MARAEDNVIIDEEQKTFVLYVDAYDMIQFLDEAEKAALLDAIFSIFGKCEMPELDKLASVVFVRMKKDILENIEKWQETKRKRSESGKKAAAARYAKKNDSNACERMLTHTDANERMRTQANECHNVNVNVNGSVNGNVNNKHIVQNEPELTDEITCASDDAPHTNAVKPSDNTKQDNPAKPRKREVDEHFDAMWAMYPCKRGKNQVSDKHKRQLMAVRLEDMRKAIDRYVAEREAEDRPWLNGSTWFKGRYLDYINDDYEPPKATHGLKPSERSQVTQFRAAGEEFDYRALEE